MSEDYQLMTPTRLQLKFFLENPAAADIAAFTSMFQRWIQQTTLDDMLIDVVDYQHVPEGPGIVLIGHESDYAIDNSNGRLGLLYTRKRQRDDSFQKQLRNSFRLTLAACQLLETEPSFRQKLKFCADEIEVRILDRLNYPNKPETFDLVQDDLKAVLADLYGSTPLSLTPISADPRHVFTVQVRAEAAESIAALSNQLQLSLAK
jgi:hypothetical protein